MSNDPLDDALHFCPRCGTALVAGHPYCPKCGFNIDALRGSREVPGEGGAAAEPVGPPEPRPASRTLPFLAGAVIIAAGLIGFGLLMRPQGGGPASPPGAGSGPGGQIGADGSAVVPSFPITGLTIQSPRDGDTVATKAVTVIGLAPPGLRVTRDVSFGLDQHADVDGTGHWAMSVDLKEGENDLVFRIGDDRSTEQRLRVTFTPPPAA